MSKMVICKTCGNDDLIEISEGLLKCKYCRHLTEKPKENAELMERAHNLRFNSKDFDEAAKIYEEVIRLTPDEAEAYWGKVLCRFGIEYVKDNNGEYLPTCHRTIKTSILEDGDYLTAVLKADDELKTYYTEQAKLIDTYQTKIKVIASKEAPYDVFISFKATDEHGRPTEDSLIAQELYYYLTKNLGLKVFFSNITLKDKAGKEYEPIIYAALSSATVMVLVGTSPKNINATWVKNEWSRYWAMMDEAKKQKKPKYIISALKGMRAEELPSTLAAYQAINIDELGAKEKLCANIDSLIGDLRVSKEAVKSSAYIGATDMLTAEAENLCNLGFQKLESGQCDDAADYFERALEKKSDFAMPYWGICLSDQYDSLYYYEEGSGILKAIDEIKESNEYASALKYATPDEKAEFEATLDRFQKDANYKIQREQKRKLDIEKYNSELKEMQIAFSTCDISYAEQNKDDRSAKLFKGIRECNNKLKDASERLNDAQEKKKAVAAKGGGLTCLSLAVFFIALYCFVGSYGKPFGEFVDNLGILKLIFLPIYIVYCIVFCIPTAIANDVYPLLPKVSLIVLIAVIVLWILVEIFRDKSEEKAAKELCEKCEHDVAECQKMLDSFEENIKTQFETRRGQLYEKHKEICDDCLDNNFNLYPLDKISY